MSTKLPPHFAARPVPGHARISPKRDWLAAVAVLVGGIGFCLAAPAAHADATVVTVMSMSSDGASGPVALAAARAMPKSQTITTFYKGHKVRVESLDDVMILDGDTGRAFTIDPKTKTYYSTNDQMASAGLLMKQLKMTSTAVVKPTGKTKAICGCTASEYAYASTVEMGLDPSLLSAAAKQQGMTAANVQKIMTMKILGTTWVTVLPSLPGGGEQAMRAENMLAGSEMRGLQLITEKLSAIKGVPLDSSQSISMQYFIPGAGAGLNGSKPQFQYTTKTSSVKESTLAASLFEVPAGYKLVKPSFPSRPGNGPAVN